MEQFPVDGEGSLRKEQQSQTTWNFRTGGQMAHLEERTGRKKEKKTES